MRNFLQRRAFVATIARALLVSSLGVAVSCSSAQDRPRPVVVIGIDGAEWRLLEQFWSEGRLPHLKALAKRGVRARLRTAYRSRSPVIWTTVATGVRAPRHGITDFVIRTPTGSVPVSSEVRKVPALWNMLTLTSRRVAVLGWWATWPVEEVAGVVVSDRIHHKIERRVFPPELEPDIDRMLEAIRTRAADLPPGASAVRDSLVAELAERVVTEDYDLVLAYFKTVDEVSHNFWKYFEPSRHENLDPAEVEAHGGHIPDAYQMVDRAIGRLVAAGGPDINLFVLSDHGFYGLKKEQVRVRYDLDRMLEQLGFLSRRGDTIDFAATRLYNYGSSPTQLKQKVRFSLAGREPDGTVKPGDRDRILAELDHKLELVTWSGGEPAFRREEATGHEARDGADFVIRTLTEGARPPIRYGSERLAGPVSLWRLSGSHGAANPGIFIAAGPDIDPTAEPTLEIHDIAPTLLFALGLPVARDFPGRVAEELFRPQFAQRHPLREIDTWGTREASGVTASAADSALLDELRALGYLD